MVNLPVHTSIFTAEAVALKLAVQYIQQQTLRKTVIYSDSLSCLQTLQNRNLEHPVIREIVHLLTYFEYSWIRNRILLEFQVMLEFLEMRWLTVRQNE